MPEHLRQYRATRADAVGLSVLVVIGALGQLASGQSDPVMVEEAGRIASVISLSLMVVGFGLILLGAVWTSSNRTALQIEFVGRVTIVLPLVAFGVTLMLAVGVEESFSISICVALAGSSAYRAWFINEKLKLKLEELRAASNQEEP